MAADAPFTIHLEQEQDYGFRVVFDWENAADLLVDTGRPLGAAGGPDAERLVAAGAGYCLTASLLFCLRNKFKQAPGKLRATVRGTFVRDDRGRQRMGELRVVIQLADMVGELRHLERCAAQFEDFCTVTQSLRAGIPVRVQVIDAAGRSIHEA